MSRGTGTRIERGYWGFARSRRRAAVLVASAGVPLVMLGQASGALAAPATPAANQPLTAAAPAQLSQNVNQHVIMVMKRQPAAAAAAAPQPCGGPRLSDRPGAAAA